MAKSGIEIITSLSIKFEFEGSSLTKYKKHLGNKLKRIKFITELETHKPTATFFTPLSNNR